MADRVLVLIRPTGVFDLLDANRPRFAIGVALVRAAVVNVEIAVVGRADPGSFLLEPHIDFQVSVTAAEEARFHNLGLVGLPIALVIEHDIHGLVERGARNEGRSHPVGHQAVRDVQGFSVRVPDIHGRGVDFAALDLGKHPFPLGCRKVFNIKGPAGGAATRDLRFRRLEVLLVDGDGRRFQIRGAERRRGSSKRHKQEQCGAACQPARGHGGARREMQSASIFPT